MIKNYENKMRYMLKHQNNKCTGCGKIIYNVYNDGNLFRGAIINGKELQPVKLDFAHNLSRTEKNKHSYPNFIDSLLNASVQCNSCNINRKRFNNKKFILPEQADKYETFLKKHPIINKFVQGEFYEM